MSAFYSNPDLQENKEITEPTQIEDGYYSSVIIGSKLFFEILEDYFKNKDNGRIVGVSVEEPTINVYFKKNGTEEAK